MAIQSNPFLSIVIPTYNRDKYLDHCLDYLIPLVIKCNVKIIVFDNASTDSTYSIVKSKEKQYPLIEYNCNEVNYGAEINFEKGLKSAKTEYIWLLGDSYRIPDKGIDYILNLISVSQVKYDAIVFNINDDITIPNQDFTECNKLLMSLGSIMTCLSSLVFSKRLINNADFARYRNTYFPQTGIIFEAIVKDAFCIHWISSMAVSVIKTSIERDRWSSTSVVFEVVCERWVNFIYSLPSCYNLAAKLKCIKNLGVVSGIFSIGHLIKLRAANILNLNIYKKYSYYWPLIVRYPKFIVMILSVMPRFICNYMIVIKKYFF